MYKSYEDFLLIDNSKSVDENAEKISAKICEILIKRRQEDVIECITKLLKNGINVKGYFIFGFPKETIKEMNDTKDLCIHLKELSIIFPGTFRASVFEFKPYHGTKMYNEIKDDASKNITFIVNDQINSDRKQFNFNAGNYSYCSDEIIFSYINEANSTKGG